MSERKAESETLLEIRNVTVRYGEIVALRDVSLSVPAHSCVSVLGPNGAGKSTLLRAISGVVPLASGSIRFAGEELTGSAARRAGAGIVHVPEGRGIFPALTVADNLRMAMYAGGVTTRQEGARLERAHNYFPRLAERRSQAAGTLSGGEQQMLSLARGLVTDPRLLVLDEMSLGLAPLVIQGLVDAVRRMVAEGVTVLLVEQHAGVARAIADRVEMLVKGEIAFSGAVDSLPADIAERLAPDRAPRAGARGTRSAPRVAVGTERVQVALPGWAVRRLEDAGGGREVSAQVADLVLGSVVNGGRRRRQPIKKEST